MSDQSWNNSWGVLPNFFLPREAIKVEALLHMVAYLQTKQNQPKTHANHPISGELCSSRVTVTLKRLSQHPRWPMSEFTLSPVQSTNPNKPRD